MSDITSLYGDGGTGKSLLALQLGVSVATGRDWMGMPVTRGRAVFLTAEDDKDKLHMRLASIFRGEGLELADVHDLKMKSLAGKDALLADLDKHKNRLRETELYKGVQMAILRQEPQLLVLDTLADLHSGEENSRPHARQFIGLVRRLALEQDCAVVLLAHPSQSGMREGTGTSGNTAWNNSVRSRLYFERIYDGENGIESDTDARLLSVKKSNYGPVGQEVHGRWFDGRFVREVGRRSRGPAAGPDKAERVFLALLEQFTSEGRNVSANPGSTYAPKTFSEHPAAEGVTKHGFKRAINTLLADNLVHIKTEGPPSKRRSSLALGPRPEADCEDCDMDELATHPGGEA